MVRAVVRVTSLASLSVQDKELLRIVDGQSFDSLEMDEDDIVVEASSPGLDPVQLVIPTSTDESVASVLAVAQKGAGQPVNFFDDDSVVSGLFDDVTKTS